MKCISRYDLGKLRTTYLKVQNTTGYNTHKAIYGFSSKLNPSQKSINVLSCDIQLNYYYFKDIKSFLCSCDMNLSENLDDI